MNNNPGMSHLRIDNEFKNLLAPLTQEEFEQLEENIMREGCCDPLVVWNRIIIDGHNRYAICMKHGIPFHIRNVHFASREAAISWICSNQLGRRNITDETKKYLIGKKYETDKVIGAKNAMGTNQHTPEQVSTTISHNKTAAKIGREHNVSPNTVYKYGAYSVAIDTLQRKNPEFAKKILDSKIKISHDNLLLLAKLSVTEIESLYKRIKDAPDGQLGFSELRQQLHWKPLPSKKVPIPQSDIPIKQTPKYDPDAEISSLSLTIPNWISSINRTRDITELSHTTTDARKTLEGQLHHLRGTIDTFLALIKEDEP